MADQPQIDLSALSDTDLDAISKGQMAKVSDEGLKHISGFKDPSQGSGNFDKAKKAGSLLWEFIATGHPNKPGKEPIEPTTAAQLLAPAAISQAAPIATEAGEGAIATDVGSYASRAGDTLGKLVGATAEGAKNALKKSLPYGVGGSVVYGAGAIGRRLFGGH